MNAQAVLAHPNNNYDSSLLESIITACSQAGLFEKSGNLYEHQQRWADAKAAYKRCEHRSKLVSTEKMHNKDSCMHVRQEKLFPTAT